jgi:hypothetical protein
MDLPLKNHIEMHYKPEVDFKDLFASGDEFDDLKSYMVMLLQDHICREAKDKELVAKIKTMKPPSLLPEPNGSMDNINPVCISGLFILVDANVEESNSGEFYRSDKLLCGRS